MIYYAAQDGVWQISEENSGQTPSLSINGLQPGAKIKVTANFTARTMTDDNDEGFYYSLKNEHSHVVPLTPASSVFQGCDGWQSSVLVVLFEITGDDAVDSTFKLAFDAGDMNGKGTLLNCTLLAEVSS